jgi:hypothetical protein
MRRLGRLCRRFGSAQIQRYFDHWLATSGRWSAIRYELA